MNEEIVELGKCTVIIILFNMLHEWSYITATNVEEFMAYYRKEFPKATVTPKLHILDHMVPWLQRCKVGFGLLDEQGAESIHAKFNSLKDTYLTMPDKLARLKHLMEAHYLHISPENLALRPPVKRKKLSMNSTGE